MSPKQEPPSGASEAIVHAVEAKVNVHEGGYNLANEKASVVRQRAGAQFLGQPNPPCSVEAVSFKEVSPAATWVSASSK